MEEILAGIRQVFRRSEYQVVRDTVPSCESGRYCSDKTEETFCDRVYQSQGRAVFLKLVSCININQKHFTEVEDT